MPSEPIKLMRIPINTNCADPKCNKHINMGAYAYFLPETNDTICIECGTKRCWTSKQRANLIVQELEIREDLKALKKQRKIDSEDLLHLKEQIDLYKLELREFAIEKQAIKLITLIDDYLKNVGSPAEKALFDKAVKTIEECRDLQKEVKEQVDARLFMLDRTALLRKRKALIPSPLNDEEEQQEEETQKEEEEPITQ